MINSPDTAHAFKEWSSVCGLLEKGATSLLLRKGGIHEGRDGFSFKHPHFFLFPTAFHQADDGLLMPVENNQAPAADPHGNVEIRIWAEADWALRLRDWQQVERLAPFHPWTEQIVRDRYSYSEKLEANCISIAFVRVYRLASPWILPYQRNFGGCRSWLDLPAPPTNILTHKQPVLDDAEHNARAIALAAITSAQITSNP